MKTKLLLIAILGLLTSPIFSQVEGNQRGLYVNQFVDLWHDNAPLHTNNTINTNSSILGNVTAENELLQYCMENHFTYLVLYDLSKVFEGMNSTTLATKLDDLKVFICKAKRDYCIKYVGASINLDTYEDVESGFGLKQTPPYIFDSIFYGTNLYDKLHYLEDTVNTDDPRFEIAEMLKLSLRIAFMNRTRSTATWTICEEESVDILVTEYEFWRNKPYDNGIQYDGVDYHDLIDEIDLIRNAHNAMSGNSKIFVETYLGRLLATNPSAVGECLIAEYIDGYDVDGERRVDRILSDYYSNNPIGVYSSTQNFYEKRFLNFCESNTIGSCTPTPPLSVADRLRGCFGLLF